ncbi:hypothetical protein [Streptomyces sp. NPDC054887]
MVERDALQVPGCDRTAVVCAYTGEFGGTQRQDKLKELRAKDAEELTQLRADGQGLVRAVNQLSLENHQLRTELAAPRGRLRLLPTQPQSPAPRGLGT